MTSPLERRYRRLLRLLPAAYRHERAGEMVDTLLTGREQRPDPGLDRGPGLAETIAVLGLAVRVRFSATSPARALALGTTGLGVALTGLALAQIVAVQRLVSLAGMAGGPFGGVISVLHVGLLVTGYLAVPATVVAVLRGRTVPARVLGVLALVPGAAVIASAALHGGWYGACVESVSDITLWIAVVCLFTRAARIARRPDPLWWCAAAAGVLLGASSGLLEAIPASLGPGRELWWMLFTDTGPGWLVALGCAGYLLGVRRRGDPAGSGALTLAVAALLTALAQIAELLFGLAGPGSVAGGRSAVFAGLTAVLLVSGVVLAVIGVRRYTAIAPVAGSAPLPERPDQPPLP